MKKFSWRAVGALILLITLATTSLAAVNDHGDSKAEQLAKEIKNPVSTIITVPFQNNWQSGLGPRQNGNKYFLNVQPVIPLSYNKDYNLFVRPIFSYISQQNVIAGTSQSGLGDTSLQMFISPKDLGPNGILWGVGPLFSFPTAANSTLGTEKWGVGPAAAYLNNLNTGLLARCLPTAGLLPAVTTGAILA